jgi:hypothetical protein
MPGILWSSEEEKTREWAFANEKLTPHGKLLPNGSKLRRKDYPDDLSHSFMVIDDKIIAISAKGIYLGSGRNAHTKLAEDKAGSLIALKIVTNDGGESNSAREAHIAHDLGIAGRQITRVSASRKYPTKQYIAYQYLGICLHDYLNKNKALSLDKRYELCIKISLALHDMHTGEKTKSKISYVHGDIHGGNIVIDDQNEPHFIDYGRSYDSSSHNPSKEDIVKMLLLFFIPMNDRNYGHDNWIFGDWVGEYKFLYSLPRRNFLDNDDPEKQTIYIYSHPNDKKENNAFSTVHYAVLDPNGDFHKVKLSLNDLGFDDIITEGGYLSEYDLDEPKRKLLESKILEITNNRGYTINQENRNETLYNLLKDPTAFYRTRSVPTALDIAETLTLCRLQLENFQSSLIGRSQKERLEAVHILNTVSMQLFALYEKLHVLPDHNSSLSIIVKNYIIAYLISSRTDSSSLDEFTLQLETLSADNAASIKQSVDDIIVSIRHVRERWNFSNLGGAAALTAGVGFFADRNAGLAKAESNATMKNTEEGREDQANNI